MHLNMIHARSRTDSPPAKRLTPLFNIPPPVRQSTCHHPRVKHSRLSVCTDESLKRRIERSARLFNLCVQSFTSHDPIGYFPFRGKNAQIKFQVGAASVNALYGGIRGLIF